MRFTTMLGAALKVAAAAALGVAALGQAGPAAAQVLPGGTWGVAQAVNLTALVPAGSQLSNGRIQDVSCPSTGNCAAIGDYIYTTSGVTSEYPFVLSETDGTWGTPAALAGIPNSNNSSAIVSCAASGECAAGWTYPGASGYGDAYLIDESGGVWGRAQPVTIGTVGTSLEHVSCAAAGDCTAVGSYVDSAGGLGIGLPFVMDSSGGTWDAPQEVPGFAGLSSPSPFNGDLTSVSCTSAGNSVAGGSYYVSFTNGQTNGQPFLATETNGSWGQPQNLGGLATLNPNDSATLQSVSCGGPGDCAAMGEYENVASGGGVIDNTWVADESGGSWGQAQELSAPAASNETRGGALSCPTQGFCVIAGYYIATSVGADEAFTATYTGGTWTVQDVPGLAPPQPQSNATAVSCAAPGYCTVVGEGALAGSGQYQVFLADDVNGTWANAEGVPGIPVSTSGNEGISCTAPGYCTAFGQANAGTTPFTASEATASAVTLTASPPTVTYGKEQAETLTTTVTSPAGGTPTGTVTVSSGSATVCSITVANGTGSCTLAATALPVGTDQLTATYNGDANYAATSSTATITVAKPPVTVTYSGTIRLYKMGYCLDDRNNSSSNGAVVQVWRCNGLANQRWQVMSDGTIRHNGLCLDAAGYGTANGTKVQLWACTGNTNQKWDTKNYRIHYDNPAAVNKVLDDTGFGGNGTRQQIWTNNGTINQLWETY
jgi:hypothetical protein